LIPRIRSFCSTRTAAPLFRASTILLLCLAAHIPLWPSSARAEEEIELGYGRGFFLQQGERKLGIYGYMQSLWTGAFDGESIATNEFRVRRGRFQATGSIDRPLGFLLHVDFASSRPLLDYHLDYRLHPALALRMGQFKTPLARQFLVLATRKQFVGDTIATSEFKLDRDIGLMVYGRFGGRKGGYELGLFNGAGKNVRQDNTDLLYVARLAIDPFGPLKLTESDISNMPAPRLSVGAAVAYNTLGTDAASTDQLTLAGELALFYRGCSAAAELFRRRDDPQSGDEITSAGEHLQVGYMLSPPNFEIAARIARVRPDVDIDGADRRETGLALNRFFEGHRLKIQLDYASLVDGVPAGKDERTRRVRLQFQALY